MKKIIILFGLITLNSANSFTQQEPLTINPPSRIQPVSSRKIQMAILFDASGSMDGLLSQAKSKIWTIVNELSSLRFQGQTPTIELAIYEYGKDEISSSENYVRQLTPLTKDLDLISTKLFGITTNGGSEFCGAVIGKSISELSWSTSPTDLRMIYIAGNEIFNQGSIDYREVCKTAADRQIYVNTIYCGPHDQGIREFWFDGAQIGHGDYFNIDANKQVIQIDTPFDDRINTFNNALNKTYYGYGSAGRENKMMQGSVDSQNLSFSKTNAVERSIVKSKSAYTNASWDLIDGDKDGKIKIGELKEEDLPEEFKGKTVEEKTELLDSIKIERDSIQLEIGKLAIERQAYIDAEIKKRATTGDVDDFGTSISQSIFKKAELIGMKKEEVIK